jgi:hypothetical protein
MSSNTEHIASVTMRSRFQKFTHPLQPRVFFPSKSLDMVLAIMKIVKYALILADVDCADMLRKSRETWLGRDAVQLVSMRHKDVVSCKDCRMI